jgi:hypothetical protein
MLEVDIIKGIAAGKIKIEEHIALNRERGAI